MKKGRPGTLLQVIAEPPIATRLVARPPPRDLDDRRARTTPVERWTLPRSAAIVQTAYGPVAVKIVVLPDGTARTTPEYDDCRRVARERGVPVAPVHAAAQAAARVETAGR